jgi:hypothetical protein
MLVHVHGGDRLRGAGPEEHECGAEHEGGGPEEEEVREPGKTPPFVLALVDALEDHG